MHQVYINFILKSLVKSQIMDKKDFILEKNENLGYNFNKKNLVYI